MANRLSESTSPYLLQHAHNPVDWYAWGDEALHRARAEDRPIFLSIGYSACHWCHVMERESFEDPATADYLNAHFVSIKVDREERPDLDQLYMQAVMALRGGHGGWPLSAFLTPAGHVFFGGTYWPPESRFGMPSFRHVLARVVDAYRDQRAEIEAQSLEVTRWIQQQVTHEAPGAAAGIDRPQLALVAKQLARGYDFHHGGFGRAPKFPHAMHVAFLLRLARAERAADDRSSWQLMVTHQLECMMRGGIYDHLGGGFARYSVDDAWLVPHFEKMLYDNALLATVYLDAGAQLSRRDFLDVGRETLDYLLRDMQHPEGAFFSAEDADSEGVEGKFYVWDRGEIRAVLGDETGRLFCDFYGATESGNFEGHNVLHIAEPLDSLARRLGRDLPTLAEALAAARNQLFAVRERRIRPLRDEKILTNWNALAMSALARGAIALGDGRYYRAAEKAWSFIQDHLLDDAGSLWHSWKDRRGAPAFLDDYSFLVVALLDLYPVEFDERWIERADNLASAMLDRFTDPLGGGLFFTASDAESLVVRLKDGQESSIPSGNAMAAWGLARLGNLLDRPDWIAIAEGIVAALARLIAEAPLACGQLLVAAMELASPREHYVLALPDRAQGEAVQRIRLGAEPGREIAIRDYSDSERHRAILDHLFEGRGPRAGQPVLHICEGTICGPAIIGWDHIIRNISPDSSAIPTKGP